MQWKILILIFVFLFPFTAYTLSLKDNAPKQYIVQEGDTLWDISAKFLHNPEEWKELWQMNQSQIGSDPDLIFPGDTLALTEVNGKPMLVKSSTKLSPQIRRSALKAAIPTIPLSHIKPFLSKSRVLPPKNIQIYPYIVSFDKNEPVGHTSLKIYVKGLTDNRVQQWDIIRPGKKYIDPTTKELLGVEGLYIGEAKVIRAGDPATLSITSLAQDIHIGDRIMPKQPDFQPQFTPNKTKTKLDGQIIGIMGENNYVGRNHVVVVNRGHKDSLIPGDVLDICVLGSVVPDPFHKKEKIQLPHQIIGQLMVFRTFERVSFAIILRSHDSIKQFDIIRTPI